ncbi:hypothetical protein V8F20_009271 [Naviculisporaceae sp. PSN 640]
MKSMSRHKDGVLYGTVTQTTLGAGEGEGPEAVRNSAATVLVPTDSLTFNRLETRGEGGIRCHQEEDRGEDNNNDGGRLGDEGLGRRNPSALLRGEESLVSGSDLDLKCAQCPRHRPNTKDFADPIPLVRVNMKEVKEVCGTNAGRILAQRELQRIQKGGLCPEDLEERFEQGKDCANSSVRKVQISAMDTDPCNIDDRPWVPSSARTTEVGRNYEPHHCLSPSFWVSSSSS